MDSPFAFVLVPVVLFLMVGIVICGAIWLAYKTKQEQHETTRKALELGHVLDPETLRALNSGGVPRPEADLRGGVIACSIGVAFLVIAVANSVTGGQGDGSQVAGFVGIVALGLGIGRLIAWKLAARQQD